MELTARVKAALDPDRILNPGQVDLTFTPERRRRPPRRPGRRRRRARASRSAPLVWVAMRPQRGELAVEGGAVEAAGARRARRLGHTGRAARRSCTCPTPRSSSPNRSRCSTVGGRRTAGGPGARGRCHASVTQRCTAMWSGWKVIPSGPNVRIVSGRTSSSRRPTQATPASSWSASAPSGSPSTRCSRDAEHGHRRRGLPAAHRPEPVRAATRRGRRCPARRPSPTRTRPAGRGRARPP